MKNLGLVYWSFSPYIWLGAEQCLMKLVGNSDITRYLIREYIQWQLLPRLPLLGRHLGCDETKWTNFFKEFCRPYIMPMPSPHNNVILIKSQDWYCCALQDGRLVECLLCSSCACAYQKLNKRNDRETDRYGKQNNQVVTRTSTGIYV